MFEKLEYSIITKANRELAWKIFSNWRRWHEFSDIYKDIRWYKGTPWETGSRLRIEIKRPVPAIVDHVIIACSPGKHVAWIDHFFGNTMEQWVVFEVLPDSSTQVRTWAEFTGVTPVLEGRSVKDLVLDFTRIWYDGFRKVCDELSGQGVAELCAC